jgi:putative ABC transport system ATP-binding protein
MWNNTISLNGSGEDFMQRFISLKDVYKIYFQGEHEVRALNGISLDISRGEFVAVVGSSGSGKSTLMNMLGCLDMPTKGDYFLDGKSVLGLGDKELSGIRNREIGFIFQGFNLVPGLTAFENVELPLVYRGVPKGKRREIAMRALEKVSLGNRVSHKPSQMSGGQQQRVAIARALAAEPGIILADEPTGNLDSRSGSEVMRVLLSLNRMGKTIILITHDENIAKQAKRIIRISDGKIVEDVLVGNEIYS